MSSNLKWECYMLHLCLCYVYVMFNVTCVTAEEGLRGRNVLLLIFMPRELLTILLPFHK